MSWRLYMVCIQDININRLYHHYIWWPITNNIILKMMENKCRVTNPDQLFTMLVGSNHKSQPWTGQNQRGQSKISTAKPERGAGDQHRGWDQFYWWKDGSCNTEATQEGSINIASIQTSSGALKDLQAPGHNNEEKVGAIKKVPAHCTCKKSHGP